MSQMQQIDISQLPIQQLNALVQQLSEVMKYHNYIYKMFGFQPFGKYWNEIENFISVIRRLFWWIAYVY